MANSPAQKAPFYENKRTVIKIVLACFAGFILLIVAVGVFAFASTASAVKAANSFTSEVVNKNFTGAYEMFSSGLKDAQSQDEFQKGLESAPFDASCKLHVTSRATNSSTDSGTTKTVSGNIKCGNTAYPTEIVFVKEDGSEKINSYSIKPAN